MFSTFVWFVVFCCCRFSNTLVQRYNFLSIMKTMPPSEDKDETVIDVVLIEKESDSLTRDETKCKYDYSMVVAYKKGGRK